MKHSKKVIAAVATAGGLLAMSSAHAIAPAAAAAVAGLAGAAIGTAAAQSSQPPVAVVQQPAPVAVVPNTVVMGAGPAVVQEVIPAPQAGYQWQQGHYEARNGVTMYVPGHWVPQGVVIYQN